VDQLSATPDLGVHERRPFVIYSCHDITILGLLYGLGADFLFDEESSDWRYWPPYGCNLVFELVRMQDGPPGPDSHVVRILLNGKPVLSVDFDKRERTWRGKGPNHILSVNDFEDVVSSLEKAGGPDSFFGSARSQ
jgi:hypothetical protein